MAKLSEIDTAAIPGGTGELRLLQRDTEFSIRIAGKPGELMNSRLHGSEDALAELACRHISARSDVRVLVGGLGMGFTLAAALQALGEKARVTVAELVPGVVEWNRGPLGAAAGYPLHDPRCEIIVDDVVAVLEAGESAFDAIMLDVDNGPEGLTRRENDRLYGARGLDIIQRALRPDGVLAVWSAGLDPAFSERLKRTGLCVEEHSVRAHRPGKGARHTIWLAW